MTIIGKNTSYSVLNPYSVLNIIHKESHSCGKMRFSTYFLQK